MNIKRNIYQTIIADKERLKAFSLLLMLKTRYTGGAVNGFCIHRLRKESGLHPDTISKYIGILEEMGFVSIKGTRMILNSIKSKHTDKNVRIEIGKGYTIKDITRAIFAKFFGTLNERKEYIGKLYDEPDQNMSLAEYKTRCKQIKKYNCTGKKFADSGVSYKYIAKTFGVSIATAVTWVKDVVRKGWLTKTKMWDKIYLGDMVKCARELGLAYGTYVNKKGYIVRQYANKYIYNDILSNDILSPCIPS